MVSFMRADEIHPPSGYSSVRHTLHPGPPYLHFCFFRPLLAAMEATRSGASLTNPVKAKS